MRVKLFQDDNTERLAERVNQWIKSQDGIRNISFQHSTAIALPARVDEAAVVVTTVLVSYGV